MTGPGAPARKQRLIARSERRRPSRPLPIGWRIAVIASVVILFWLSVPNLVGFYDVPLVLAFVLSSVQCVTIVFAVRFARSAALAHIISVVFIGIFTRTTDEFWPVPIPNLLALTMLLILLGLRERWAVSVSVWWLSFLGMTVVVALNPDALTTRSEWGVDVMISVTVTLIALAVSVTFGQRGRVREIVATAKRDVELEQARRATVEERARIARELHDVVAHSMSIVHIQAESARYRVVDLDEARNEFNDIARSARAALGEMRQLLEALHPDEEPLYAPQPTIADIAALVRSTEKVGSRVEFVSEVNADEVSRLIQLTVYRIVQEALSNVIRHAPHASVRVHLRQSSENLEVRVKNDAPPRSADPRNEERGGRGLRGMRERVALVHGEVEQIPLPGGGFLIAVTLPTTIREETV